MLLLDFASRAVHQILRQSLALGPRHTVTLAQTRVVPTRAGEPDRALKLVLNFLDFLLEVLVGLFEIVGRGLIRLILRLTARH